MPNFGKNKTLRILGLVLAAALMLTLMACGTATKTKMTKVTNEPDYQRTPLTRVLIVSFGKRGPNRVAVESRMAKEFNDRGVVAGTALSYLPKGKEMDKDVILQVARANKAPVIFATFLMGIDTTVSTARSYSLPTNPWYPGETMGTQFASYTTEHDKALLLSILVDTKTGKRIWSAESETKNPKSLADVLNSYVPKVMKQLQTDGFIK